MTTRSPDARRVDLDGTSLAYDAVGSGTCLLFLHGIGLDSRAWQRQVPAFSSRCTVLCPDLRGHGRSTTDPSTITLARFVDDMAELLRRESAGSPAHVCGNSLGSLVAVQLAADHSDLVKSLTLSDGWVYNESSAHGVDEMLERARTSSMHEIAATRVPVVFGPHASQEVIDSALDVMSSKDFDAYLATSRAMWTADLRDACPRVRAPTLVLVGEVDRVSPPERSEELASAIGGARYEVIAEAGHVPNVERPEEFNTLLSSWLDEVDD